MSKFFKGFFIALGVCLVVWLFWWVFKALFDFVLGALGATVGLVWALGTPAVLIVIGCIIFGIWYMRNK